MSVELVEQNFYHWMPNKKQVNMVGSSARWHMLWQMPHARAFCSLCTTIQNFNGQSNFWYIMWFSSQYLVESYGSSPFSTLLTVE